MGGIGGLGEFFGGGNMTFVIFLILILLLMGDK
jgi:hypothetical protein